MVKWEYVTVPLLTHATKQILDNWGVDGWELVTVIPGPAGSDQLVAYLKRAQGLRRDARASALAELGLTPAGRRPAGGRLRAGRPHRVAGLHLRPAAHGRRRASPYRQGRRRGRPRRRPRRSPGSARSTPWRPSRPRSATCPRVARVVKVVGFVASAPGFTGQPQVVNGASELLAAGVRRRRPARPLGGGRRRAAPRRAGRGRARRRARPRPAVESGPCEPPGAQPDSTDRQLLDLQPARDGRRERRGHRCRGDRRQCVGGASLTRCRPRRR